MNRIFLCLANSRKYTERCIAGIELIRSARSGYRYDIVFDANRPRWLRPVSESEHGAVATHLVDHISLLDVVEFNEKKKTPQNYQSENLQFHAPLTVIDNRPNYSSLVDKLISSEEGPLFNNISNKLSECECKQLGFSLTLIKPQSASLYRTSKVNGNLQTRSRFEYGGCFYDLPITDIAFLNSNMETIDKGAFSSEVYFTISLGIPFQGFHYKLIAGIIECEQGK